MGDKHETVCTGNLVNSIQFTIQFTLSFDVASPWTRVWIHDHQFVLIGIALKAGLGDEVLLGACQAGEIVQDGRLFGVHRFRQVNLNDGREKCDK